MKTLLNLVEQEFSDSGNENNIKPAGNIHISQFSEQPNRGVRVTLCYRFKKRNDLANEPQNLPYHTSYNNQNTKY